MYSHSFLFIYIHIYIYIWFSLLFKKIEDIVILKFELLLFNTKHNLSLSFKVYDLSYALQTTPLVNSFCYLKYKIVPAFIFLLSVLKQNV